MTIGTRSILYGAHCAVLHPWFLALAWWKLYGFPWDVRLWTAFWVHDIGYFSKNDMDGASGETHVELGARIMGLLFGESWAAFTAAHSQYWAKRNGRQFSRLCVADKLAFVLTCCAQKSDRRGVSTLPTTNPFDSIRLTLGNGWRA